MSLSLLQRPQPPPIPTDFPLGFFLFLSLFLILVASKGYWAKTSNYKS